MVRLIISRARQHFNRAVEHAEQQRYYEALGELNDALELNSRFAEALVLRGSILARLDRLDEAQESWDAALALNAQAARAHRYLGQMEDVRRAAPLLRRTRAVVFGSAGVAIGCLLLAVVGVSAMRDPDRRHVQRAMVAMDAARYGEAYNAAQEVSARDVRKGLLAIIGTRIDAGRDAALAAAERGEFEAAMVALAPLREAASGTEAEAALEKARAAVRDRMLQSIASQAIDFRDPSADAMVRRYVALFPNERSALDRTLAGMRDELRGELSRQLMALRETELQGAGLSSALASLERAAPIAERLGPEAQREVESAAGAFSERVYTLARELVRQNNRSAFERLDATVSAAVQIPETQRQRVRALRSILLEQEMTSLANSLREARAEQNNRRVLDIARTMQALDPAPSETLGRIIAEAEQALAIESFYGLMEQADTIERGKLDEGNARRVLELVREARGPLPPRLRMRAEENLHYFAARAHEALGDEEKAREELDRLRENYPESPYLVMGSGGPEKT